MPKAKITRNMVIDAAFEVARAAGAENVNARTVAEKLGCSTQPVMYHFARIEDLKRAVYAKLDWLYTEYLMTPRNSQEDPILTIGMNYIRFATEEPNLFRFLFQSGFAVENSLREMVDSDELKPVLAAMQTALGMNAVQTKKIFLSVAVFTHGYASILANESLEYDEKQIETHLDRAFRGAVLAVREEEIERAD